MQKKISIVSLLISILLIITIFIGTSYSLWTTSVHQESTNTIDVGCFRIEFSDEGIIGAGNISLDKAYPMQDDVGKSLVPYKFTIANQCTVASSYNVILETLDSSTMDESKLKVYLSDNSVKQYANNVSEGLSEDANNGMNLTKGYLGAGESITYSLRVWIDYDVTVDTPNVQGKVWNGRIVVNSEATFTKPTFTNKVVGEDNVTLDIDTKNDKTVQTLECYYGNKISQNEVGTAVGKSQCQYPLTAEYAKFKVTYTDGTTDSSYPLKLIETISLIDKINELKTNGSIELEYDETVDNNLRYVGANPNNYVEFNGELWRIIGLMNNIEKEDGTTESLVKIRRAESLGSSYSWDTSDSSINHGYGINQWGASGSYEGADLMRELNTDYLGNITVGTDSKWYDDKNNSKENNMPTSTLSSDAQSMIQIVKWNLGSPSNNNGTYDSSSSIYITPNFAYTSERANTNGKVCTSGTYCNDTVNRTSTWIGKVGLIYPSDYGYATSGGTTTNREICLTTSMNKWNRSEVSDCKNNDWLLDRSYQWSFSPYANSNYASELFGVNMLGSVSCNDAYYTGTVFPVVFLKSSITITSGNGSESSPYRLIME